MLRSLALFYIFWITDRVELVLRVIVKHKIYTFLAKV